MSAHLCYHVSNSVVFVHHAGTLAKGYPTAIQAVLKAKPLPFEKELNINFCLSFLLEACQRNAAGWSMAVWPANANSWSFHFPSCFINHSTLLLERSSAKILFFTCTPALDRLRMRRSVRSTHCRGNHLHDHSRFQRDIDWRHRPLSLSLCLSLLLLLLLLTKVTHAQNRKRFRASYNVQSVDVKRMSNLHHPGWYTLYNAVCTICRTPPLDKIACAKKKSQLESGLDVCGWITHRTTQWVKKENIHSYQTDFSFLNSATRSA